MSGCSRDGATLAVSAGRRDVPVFPTKLMLASRLGLMDFTQLRAFPEVSIGSHVLLYTRQEQLSAPSDVLLSSLWRELGRFPLSIY